MDQIITFDKSLQTRLQEYEDVFSGLETLPYTKIQSEWAYYLELTLDPNGWQAVWKIPRIRCEEMKIPFPTVVLVYVLNVNHTDLTALVRILAVQEDIHLPEKHYVPLTQLWPTKEQDKSIAINLNSTANALDMLRFFYIHILMPWDEDDDSADWKAPHLVSRLRLFYDLKNGKIPKGTSEHIHALLNEARRLNSKRQLLTNICDEFDCDIEGENDKNMESLIEINVRLIEIQNEMHLLENEMFRKVIIKRQESTEISNREEKEKSQIWLICRDTKAADYISFLTSVEELYPNESLTFATDIMSKLESANLNDTILLCPSKHNIKAEGALIENFTIKGVGERNSIEIVASADVMFDCIGDSSVIENITFNCRNTQCAILVRKGHVTIKNCKIIGDCLSTTHQGILVLNGAKLSLTNCEISGFSMAVIGNSGSTIDFKDSVIDGASCGIKVYDNCQMALSKITIRNCKEYAVVVETEQDYSSDSFETLNQISHFTVVSTTGSNNQKGDVIIKKTNIKAMDNLFANPDLDPTIIDWSSDEEMETSHGSNLNNTVLEVKKVKDEDVIT